MFLEEELEQIYKENKQNNNPIAKGIIHACVARFEDPKVVGAKGFFNSIKRTIKIYEQFASKHSDEFNVDGLKNVMLNKIPELKDYI